MRRANPILWLTTIALSALLMGMLASCTHLWGYGEPSIEIRPRLSGPGTLITVKGDGFPAVKMVSVRLGPPTVGATPKSYATTTADEQGRFTLTFVMPDRWPDGELIAAQELVVIVLNEDGSVKATGLLDYAPSWPATGTTVAPQIDEASTAVLTWHRRGGASGYCDDLVVYEDGRMVLSECRGTGAVETRHLSEQELATMRAWVSSYASFSFEKNTGSGSELLTVRTRFVGQGTQQLSRVEKQALQDFCGALAAAR